MKTLSNDNIYPVGMNVAAELNPSLALEIHSYYQRIYYCAAVGDSVRNHVAYFEHELIPQVELGQKGEKQ